MEDIKGFTENKLSTVVIKEGVKLSVIAIKVEEEQWSLSVQNEYGICSNWFECFPTAQTAIEAGIKAIEKEGVEPFLETDGFEYLFE